MNPATKIAASGSRIGSPSRAPASAHMTASDVHTSLRVCIASASSTSLASRSAARPS